jgi:hypothetical protein
VFPSQATRHRRSKHAEKSFPILLTRFFDYRSHPSILARIGADSIFALISYTPSQADVAVFKALSQDLGYPNVARWYKHIKSYEAEFSTLSGSSSAGAVFTGEATPAPAEVKEEEAGDDDIDLFGSDEEVDAEAEKLKAERVAAYNAKKANKPKTIAKVRDARTSLIRLFVDTMACSLL